MNHTLVVDKHKIHIDGRKFVQNGVNHDTLTVQTDAEWDVCDRIILTIEHDAIEGAWAHQLTGEPVAVPSGYMAKAGTMRFSLTGYVGDEARLTTERMSEYAAGLVVASGTVSGGGETPRDADPDLWLQLMQQVGDASAALDEETQSARGYAEQAAASATQASESASAASSSARQAKASETASKASQDAAKASEDAAAKSAGDAAASAQGIADSVSAAAKSAEDAQAAATTAQGYAETAATKASEASQSATDAQTAQSAAETARTAAESAKTAAETARSAAEGAASTASTQAQTAEEAAGDAESAKQSAEQAAESASGAATSAQGAATSAQQAATSAQGAASSAQEAAQSASQAAESAEEAAQSAISVLQNVPTKTVTDLVSHAEDAYPQKPREVRIKGKTWVNRLPGFTTVTGVSGKITVSMAEDGLITLNASADTGTGAQDRYYVPLSDNIVFTPNKSMTLLVSSGNVSNISDADWYIYVAAYDEEYRRITPYEIRNQASMTTAVTPGNTQRLNISVAVKSGITVNASFRVMLVDGSEAPDCFTPPASITSVQTGNLVTAGKNLINLDGAEYVRSTSSSSSSATFSEDGTVTINGATDSWNGCYIELKSVVLPPGTYTTSGLTNPDMLALLSSKDQLNGRSSGKYYTEKGYPYKGTANTTFRVAEPSRVAIATGNRIGDGESMTFRPQIELGSTATAYEPPDITTTPLPEVELRSLPNGTCDELVIKEDGTCEVERCIGEAVIDAEHPINVTSFTPASGTNLPYVLASQLFPPFDSPGTSVTTQMLSTSWPFTNTLKSRGVYRTWNSTVFVDERFTDKGTAQSIINETGGTFAAQVPMTTEPQSPVTLPALPAPTFNQYHDSPVPSDTSTEYVRDINMVLANLEAVNAALLGEE